jgi:ComF family protein
VSHAILSVFDRFLSLLARPRCAACDHFLARDAAFCAACVATLEPPPPLPRDVTASFAFGGALAEAIRRFKYLGRSELARPLGRAIVHALPDPSCIDVVAPAPLHRRRLRHRGFDQAALLARHVARSLDRPLEVELLRRTVDTPRLATLSAAERKSVVARAFVARPCIGVRVLLVDDVHTTGATLTAATRAIEIAGGLATSHVLAATPRDRAGDDVSA